MSKRHKRIKTLRAGQQPDFERLFPTCNRTEIQAIQIWYASEFERRVAEATETLRAEVATEPREQECDELPPQNTDGSALLSEIAAVHEALEKKDEELTVKLADDAFPFSTILRLRTEKLELTSYLKGLNFRASGIQVDQSETTPYNETAHC